MAPHPERGTLKFPSPREVAGKNASKTSPKASEKNWEKAKPRSDSPSRENEVRGESEEETADREKVER